MNVRRLLSLVSLVFVAVAARPVLAVCMGAQEYRVSPLGSTLIIIPTNFQRRRCPDPDGLLRQNVDTGQVVKIDACIGTDGFLDECVPPGKYRYGLAMPYRCCEACCNTDYFTELTIAIAPPANCDATRMPDKPRPTAYTGRSPGPPTRRSAGSRRRRTPPAPLPRTRPETTPAGRPASTPGPTPVRAAPGMPRDWRQPRPSVSFGWMFGGRRGWRGWLTAFLILGGLALVIGARSGLGSDAARRVPRRPGRGAGREGRRGARRPARRLGDGRGCDGGGARRRPEIPGRSSRCASSPPRSGCARCGRRSARNTRSTRPSCVSPPRRPSWPPSCADLPAPAGKKSKRPAAADDIVVVDVVGQKRGQFRAVTAPGSDEPPKDLRFPGRRPADLRGGRLATRARPGQIGPGEQGEQEDRPPLEGPDGARKTTKAKTRTRPERTAAAPPRPRSPRPRPSRSASS